MTKLTAKCVCVGGGGGGGGGGGTYPGNHQGVISTPKHKISGKMTPSCILQDFLYLFESKEIFQKFHY